MVLNFSRFNSLFYCRDAPAGRLDKPYRRSPSLGRLDKPYRRSPSLGRLDKSYPKNPPLVSGTPLFLIIGKGDGRVITFSCSYSL